MVQEGHIKARQMTEPMERVLMIVHTNSYFTGLFPLAKMLVRAGRFAPTIMFTREYPTLADDLKACQQESIRFMMGKKVKMEMDFNAGLPEKKSGAGRKRLSTRVRKYARLLRSPAYLVHTLLSKLLAGSILWEVFTLAGVIAEVRKLIRAERSVLMILPADNRYDQAAYIKAAHLESIGAVVVPQFMASSLEWAEYVVDQPAYQQGRFLNRLAGSLYPKWALVFKNRKLVAQPGVQIIARELLGVAPPQPWILHSGHADALALESTAVLNYCLAEGLPAEKLFVTGSVSLDVLSDSMHDIQHRKAEMCKSLGIESDKPIILSALPPDSLYMGRPECDFQVYEELVEFWCRSISAIQTYHHLVALHPSVRYEDMKHIERFGLKIVRNPTMDVVPLCDIFVASISSTIQWAIACGKPVLNYDVFRYRYTDYQNVRGVITIEEKHDFLHMLNKLTSVPGFFASMVSRQAEFAQEWGRLDGRAGERLQELFVSVVERYGTI
jgi:hypothetical protein